MPGGHPAFVLHMPNIPASAILRQTDKEGEREREERQRQRERERERESKKERKKESEAELIIPKKLITNLFIQSFIIEKHTHTVTSISK